MAFNIGVRKKQLESLNQYIKSSKENVEAIFKSIGWNPNNNVLEAEDSKMKCPFNTNHLVSLDKADQHLRKCKIKSEGYDLSEEFLSQPAEDSTSCIKLDNSKKIEILNAARYSNHMFKPAWNGQDVVPMTSNRLLSTFSPDERLCLYDYSVANTQKPPVPEEFTLSLDEAKENGDKSYEESLKKQRDLKRRRTKYKSVHTDKKSHTEVIKEVIDNQMEQYTEWLLQKVKQEAGETSKASEIKSEPLENSEEYLVQGYSTELLERPRSSISSRHSVHSSSSRSHRRNGEEDYGKIKRDYIDEERYDNSVRQNVTNNLEYNSSYHDKSYSGDRTYSPEKSRRQYHDQKREDSGSRHEKSYHHSKGTYGHDKERSRNSNYKSFYKSDRKKRSDGETRSRIRTKR